MLLNPRGKRVQEVTDGRTTPLRFCRPCLQFHQDALLGSLQPYVYGVAVDLLQRGGGGGAPSPAGRQLLGSDQARSSPSLHAASG